MMSGKSGLLARLAGRGRRHGGTRRRPRDLARHAETLTIPKVEGRSGAILRPGGITYDVGEEFDAYAADVSLSEDASGVAASRTATTRAAGLGSQADAARARTACQWPEVEAARQAYTTARDDLDSFSRRRAGDRTRYKVTYWVLLLGDFASVFGAALFLGEVPVIAAGQAVAAGVAAVTAGIVGADVRELRLARERSERLEAGRVRPEVAARYPRLFGTASAEKDTYQQALKVALAIVLLLGLSVLALRAAIEGLAGVVFGGLAMATALASFINCWSFADDVSDVVDTFRQRFLEALSLHRALADAPQPSAQDAHAAEAASIQSEYDIRGQAKAAGVRALKHEVYRRNPQVFGHGLAEFRSARLDIDRELTRHAEPYETPQAASPGVNNRFQSNGHPQDR